MADCGEGLVLTYYDIDLVGPFVNIMSTDVGCIQASAVVNLPQ
jgi:hypothetical protein